MRWLVIGVGNELRRDDGLGAWLVERIAACRIPGVETRTVQQLMPELAAEIVRFDRVVFVDADRVHAEPTLMRVSAHSENARFGHAMTAGEVLGLAEMLGNHPPQAWLALIPGVDFGYGEGLSEPASRSARAFLSQIVELLSEAVPCTESD